MLKYVIFLFILFSVSVVGRGQVITDSILIENHYRSFHFKKITKNSNKAKLIFVLHGSGGSGIEMMQMTDSLEAIASKENIVLVYANGYKKFWNECRKASTALANVENINEQAFFTGMIDYFGKNYNCFTTYAFAVGFSGGGQMAFKLALTMPEKFFAITTIVANLPTDANNDCVVLHKPVAVMMINGTADGVNPYNGGEMKTANLTLGNVQSTDASFMYWVKENNYTQQPLIQNIPDADTTDTITIEKTSYINRKKYDLVLYKIVNGKHTFPIGMDAFTSAWYFFKKQMGKGLVSK
jgi:polyhydroxybutyrate depolymerase